MSILDDSISNNPRAVCEICGRVFLGEDAEVKAYNCKEGHKRYFISIWDYELPALISGIRTNNFSMIPKDFIKGLYKLESAALRGK